MSLKYDQTTLDEMYAELGRIHKAFDSFFIRNGIDRYEYPGKAVHKLSVRKLRQIEAQLHPRDDMIFVNDEYFIIDHIDVGHIKYKFD